MLLNRGRNSVAIPGPSIIPDRVLAAMQRPSPNIYDGKLIDIAESLYPDLKSIARTDGNVAIYIANGHGSWEAGISNVLSPGDRVIALNTGFFGSRWGFMARTMGIDVEVLDFGMDECFDPGVLRDRLGADTSPYVKAVFAVQTDTASSVRNDIPELRAVLDDVGHESLLMVDCIASLGCEPHEMDAWGVDVMNAACQKGLMTPAGMSFVYFNDRAKEARARVSGVSGYWDWVPRTEPEHFYQLFGGTAPTHHIFALREALDILVHEEGVANAWARHERLAGAVWAAIDRWADGSTIRPGVSDPSHRSHAVTTIRTTNDLSGSHNGDTDADRIRQWCESRSGVTLGIGLGFPDHLSGSAFRIGHMGHLNPPMILGTLGCVDSALKALGIPHGDGALEAASRVISEADATFGLE